MRSALILAFTAIFLIPALSRACSPRDASRAAEVAFNNDEIFDLSRFATIGKEKINYLIEDPSVDNLFPGDETVVVYQSHFDQQAMIKVGYSPTDYEWRSVLIVLPETGINPEKFNFPQAMAYELQWLSDIGVIENFEQEKIPIIISDMGPSIRYFTREMTASYQNCFVIDHCVRCEREEAFTELPPKSFGPIAVFGETWGWVKSLFISYPY